MIRNKLALILSFFVVSALFLSSFVLAVGPPTLSSVPEPRWIADGTTQYKVKVVADNGPMQEITRGIQFEYNLPEVPGYQFNVVGVTVRPQQDFSTGFNTNDFVNGNAISRSIFGAVGPMNVQGNVVYLWVTVSQTDVTQGPKQASFGFNSDPKITYFTGATPLNHYTPTLLSTPFTVVPQNYQVHPNGPTGVSPEDPVKVRCSQIGSIIRNRC